MSRLCTPEYNERTREMMRQRDELRRIAEGAKTGDFGAAMRAKQKELIAAGETDAGAVVTKVRDWIRQWADHSTREVSDALSGYGRERTETRDVLQQRLNAMNKELREISRSQDLASGKIDPNAAKNKARQTALEKEIADIQERIRTGDYDKPEKARPEYTKETLRLQGLRDTAKRKLDMLIAAREAKNLSAPRKFANFLVALHRATILSGYHVLGKLAAYSVSELAAAPLNSIVSEAWRRVPGIRQVYENAPIAGAGFVPKAEAARFKALVDPETWKRAGKAITQGFDDMDAMFGDKADHVQVNRWLEIPGRIHSAEKTALKASTEAHARVLYEAQRLRELKLENPKATDAELMAKVQEPEEQAAIMAKAYTKGQEAILQNDNAAVKAYRGFIRILKGKEGDATARLRNAIVYFLEYELPIVKVPANVVDRLSGYAPGIGQAKALSSLRFKKEAGKLKLNMSEEEAEYFARNLNNSTIGTVAALAGWYGYKSITGYYQQGDNKKGREAETATVAGRKIPRAVFHHPLLGVMQMWATVHRVYDEKHGGASGAVSGVLAGTRGAVEQLPFLDYVTRQGANFKDAESLSNWAGKEAAELVPQAIKDYAADTDPAETRKAKGFVQEMQKTWPGQREKLPQR